MLARDGQCGERREKGFTARNSDKNVVHDGIKAFPPWHDRFRLLWYKYMKKAYM